MYCEAESSVTVVYERDSWWGEEDSSGDGEDNSVVTGRWGDAKARKEPPLEDEANAVASAASDSSWRPLLSELNVDSILVRMKASNIPKVSLRWTMTSQYRRSAVVDKLPKNTRLIQVSNDVLFTDSLRISPPL